ncbi:MAG: ATPase [Albidovulum sp.]|nr:ATPase [Albidovulum sp.]
MIYKDAEHWLASGNKRILLFGMSGVGKTHVSDILRKSGQWFHYSVDYRIGTRYMGEYIVDNFKREAMRNEFLAELLKTDSIYIASNITFENLAPLSTYLGKPGDPGLGGIPYQEYKIRQQQHRHAEIASLKETKHFVDRAEKIYGYRNFVCDSGGSICEVVDTNDPSDDLMNTLAEHLLLIWIRESDDHAKQLAERFDRAPKPMYYHPSFLDRMWSEYCGVKNCRADKVDPDDFVRWIYVRAIERRMPRYRAMAENWGIQLYANDIKRITSASEFCDLVAASLDDREYRV